MDEKACSRVLILRQYEQEIITTDNHEVSINRVSLY